jgi:hypothetical protein
MDLKTTDVFPTETVANIQSAGCKAQKKSVIGAHNRCWKYFIGAISTHAGEAAIRQPALLSTFFGKQTMPSLELGVGLIKMLPPSQSRDGDFDSSEPQLERA